MRLCGRTEIDFAASPINRCDGTDAPSPVFIYDVENATKNTATQKRADISAANKKPKALSLMRSSSGNLHRLEETIREFQRVRYPSPRINVIDGDELRRCGQSRCFSGVQIR